MKKTQMSVRTLLLRALQFKNNNIIIIIPLYLMAYESIAHMAIDSEPTKAPGIIVNYCCCNALTKEDEKKQGKKK